METVQLELAAQSITSLGEQETITWMEILCRPLVGGKAVDPDLFFRQATERGDAAELDLEICRLTFDWLAHMPRVQRCSINLAGSSVSQVDFVDKMEALLGRREVDACRICFEISVAQPIARNAVAQRFCQRMREAGATIALDDFGIGAANLELCLPEPQVDFIKIDKTFTDQLTRGDGPKRLVAGMVALARELGARSIAEGVESDDQAVAAGKLGVGFAQGFFRGRPQLVMTAGSGQTFSRPAAE